MCTEAKKNHQKFEDLDAKANSKFTIFWSPKISPSDQLGLIHKKTASLLDTGDPKMVCSPNMVTVIWRLPS